MLHITCVASHYPCKHKKFLVVFLQGSRGQEIDFFIQHRSRTTTYRGVLPTRSNTRVNPKHTQTFFLFLNSTKTNKFQGSLIRERQVGVRRRVTPPLVSDLLSLPPSKTPRPTLPGRYSGDRTSRDLPIGTFDPRSIFERPLRGHTLHTPREVCW